MAEPRPAPNPGGKKLLGLNKWAWAGVIALGVVVFLYFRHHSGNGTPKAASDSSALDEGQLASDVAGQTAAALGGQPPDTSLYDYLAGLLDWQTQSLQDYFSSFPFSGGGLGGSGSVGNDGGGAGEGGSVASGPSAGTGFASTFPVASSPYSATGVTRYSGGGITPQAAATQTFPAGTSVGTTDVGGVPYTGYTDSPVAVSSQTGEVTNGILPPITYEPGFGAPVLDTLFQNIYTPAYSPNPDNVQNATTYAATTHNPVAI